MEVLAINTVIFSLLNFGLLVVGLAWLVLFILVLFKLNKALNIWLKQNKD